MATPKQVSFLESLIDERDLFASPRFFDAVNAMDSEEYATYLGQIKRSLPNLPTQKASAYIEHLLALPKKAEAPRSNGSDSTSSNLYVNDVPAGRYAVENEDGVLRFYRVDKPEEGRWAGRTFVSVQASDDWFPVKARDSRNAILAKIQADGPREASMRYGREIGHCGICGRTLTDNESIARGIGPVCAQKFGW